MEVVEEPLRRGGDELAPVHVVGHGEVGLAQDAGVVVEAREDVSRRAAAGFGSRVNRAARALALSSSRSMLSSSSRRGFSAFGGRRLTNRPNSAFNVLAGLRSLRPRARQAGAALPEDSVSYGAAAETSAAGGRRYRQAGSINRTRRVRASPPPR